MQSLGNTQDAHHPFVFSYDMYNIFLGHSNRMCPACRPYRCFTHFLLSSRTSFPCLLSGAMTRSTDQFFLQFFGVCTRTIKSTSAGRLLRPVKLPIRCISEMGRTFFNFCTIFAAFFHASFLYEDRSSFFGG